MTQVKARRREKVESLIANGTPIVGEVISWRCAGPHSRAAVITALNNAGLDSTIVKEFLARHAFSRATKQLEEDRIIDILKDEKDTLTFQFTRRKLDRDGEGEVYSFHKETLLRLNKTTGKITCKIKELEERAQKELDRCMEERTTSDITKMVQTLFDRQSESQRSDLIPIRDQGGCYLVLSDALVFVSQVETFLRNLGGSMRRFPVQGGTDQGDKSVQECIEGFLQGLVSDHNKAVEGFSLQTRQDTIEESARKINETRVKVEAYASFLEDKKDALLKEVEKAKKKLAEQVKHLAEARINLPDSELPEAIKVLHHEEELAMTVKEVAEAAGLKGMPYVVLERWVENGCVIRTEDGRYYRRKGGKKE